MQNFLSLIKTLSNTRDIIGSVFSIHFLGLNPKFALYLHINFTHLVNLFPQASLLIMMSSSCSQHASAKFPPSASHSDRKLCLGLWCRHLVDISRCHRLGLNEFLTFQVREVYRTPWTKVEQIFSHHQQPKDVFIPAFAGP